MPEFADKTKLTVLLDKVQHAVTWAARSPGYISVQDQPDGRVIFSLNTAMLAHGGAAKQGLEIVEKVLKQHFGDEAVSMKEVIPSEDNMDFAPASYKLSAVIPVNMNSFKKLEQAHKDVAVEYCRAHPTLKDNMDEMLAYLADELEPRQAEQAMSEVTGAQFEYSHRQRHAPANRKAAAYNSI